MDRWDVILVAVACYVAVISLVRLMARRRNELVEQVRKQIGQQHHEQQAAKRETNDADRGAA